MIRLQKAFPPIPEVNSGSRELLAKFRQTIEDQAIGFFQFSAAPTATQRAKEIAKNFHHKKLLVHVGIGGSSLGPEMLMKALLGENSAQRVQFVNNIDPDMLFQQQKAWKCPDVFFYIVSKSGGTAETMAALAIILRWLSDQGVTPEQWKNYLVICTDPQKGDLRNLAVEYQLPCLTVPENIGGRFSVLTDVGLLPAAWAGLDVDQLVAGAESIKPLLITTQPEQNLLHQLSVWIIAQYHQGRSLTVLMPYSSLLKDFTAWWVQLWAESLGKESQGLTPIMAYGATDQHSQMQLFMQGPHDKTVILLGVDEHSHDYSLSSHLSQASAKLLAPFKLSELLQAEHYGTMAALEEAKRPYLDLRINKLDAATLGGLILLFESLTVMVGLSLKINPFNQPGVEAGKKFALEWLSQHAP